MPEFAGSFVAGEDGVLRPNLDDEAMAERERQERATPPSAEPREEVESDG